LYGRSCLDDEADLRFGSGHGAQAAFSGASPLMRLHLPVAGG
jgi:hypothetical protein